MSWAVEVELLRKVYGSFVAVDDVSFQVGKGEVFGFLGPNGAGKTTTIKILTGLVAPTAGRGRVAGLEIGRDMARIKQSIGYMSQLFSLYGDLTVAENIDFFGGLYGVAGARLNARRQWVLEQAGLESASRQKAGELSLGFKQRLALGCAVLHEPPILFLDEPTSGVDPASRRRFWQLIDELAAAGTTVFVSTHYMEEAEYCHRLALMNRGRLIALDTPGGLRAEVGEILYEIECHEPIAALQVAEGLAGVRRVGLFGRRLHLSVDRSLANEAFRRGLAEALGVDPASLRRIPPSLEDVFIALVDRAGGAPTGES